MVLKLPRRLDPRRWALASKLKHSDPKEEVKLLLQDFLAGQHCIRGEKELFDRALTQFRDNLSRSGKRYFLRAGFLEEVLQANSLFQEGRYSEAQAKYQRTIEDVHAEFNRTLSRRFRLKERHKLNFLLVGLSLMYNNLAETLAKIDPENAVKAFSSAIEFGPNLPFVRENLAIYYMNRELWTEAEGSFLDAYLISPTKTNEERLQGNIAFLRYSHAEKLHSLGNSAEAIKILKNCLTDLSKTDLHGWKGKIHFLLAKIYRDQCRNIEAEAAYAESSDLYRKASDLRSASFVREELGNFHAKLKNDEEARRDYEQSLNIALGNHDPGVPVEILGPIQARLQAKIGILHLVGGNYREAQRALEESRQIWLAEGWSEPFRKIFPDIRNLLESDEASLQLRLYLDWQIRHSEDAERTRDLIIGLRSVQRDSEKYVTTPEDSVKSREEKKPILPVVTPLAIEIDTGVLDAAGNIDLIIDRFFPAMRERIQNRYGVKVPGVRLRGNETDLPFGTYILMIHEVPLRSGTLLADRRLYVGYGSALDAIRVSSQEQSKTFEGEEAHWIGRADWNRVESAGLPLWGVMEYPVRDLEALIVANLVEFVGHQEVQNLLETNQLVGPEGFDIITKETYSHMDPLTNVVRALVSERVPITDFPHIYQIFSEQRKRSAPLGAIIDAIRDDPIIQPRLWGNDDSYFFLSLGSSVMEAVDRSIRDRDQQVLALEPEVVQAILTAVRHKVGSVESPAIIVPRQNRRSLIRKVLELEFPDIPVLALAELRPGLGARILETIELE